MFFRELNNRIDCESEDTRDIYPVTPEAALRKKLIVAGSNPFAEINSVQWVLGNWYF